jgi:esterase/lipase superfamily enzyme
LKIMGKRDLAVCFLAILVSRCPAEERPIQEGPGGQSVRIVGTLTDFQKAPIGDATIGLARWDMTVWQPLTRSSAAGTFELRVQLQPGAYQVIAALGPYEVTRGNLSIKPKILSFTVDLRASEDKARSDSPPDTTPSVGRLPRGSFPPPRYLAANISRPFKTASPGTQEFVTVYYATNRTSLDGQPAHYMDRSAVQLNMSYGICTVSIPPTHRPGRLERPSIWRFERVENIRDDIVITNREPFSEETAFQEKLRQAFRESRLEAFIFIHGYNVPFDGAVRRTAQLFRDLQFNGVPILFSWPAQDGWWRYLAAEDIVDASARQLEELLLHTLVEQKLTAVNVIAHSMGNRILKVALERLALEKANIHFKNVVMAAPDINVADFAAVSGILRKSAAHTTIYSSSRDVALLISKAFHSYPRLGEAPPAQLAPGIDTVDASAIRRDLLGHSYFGDSATMLRDMFLLISNGLNPQERFLQPVSVGSLQYWVVPRE